jgi:hypoxanthine phosphoribosyltransferase
MQKKVVTMTVDEANRLLAEADLLASEAEVTAAIERLAAEMTARLAGKRPVMLCVMNGALIFAGQLLTKLTFPLEVEYIHATRYGSDTEGGPLDWIVCPTRDLEGRTVVLLDDILDEGVTLASIAEYCKEAGADEVLMAVLVDKRHSRKVAPGYKADFTGIETADRFLFGYGLDYKGFWRNAPGIYAVKGL